MSLIKQEDYVKRWMRQNAKDFENATQLVEATQLVYDTETWVDDPNHEIWDWALEFYE